MTCDTVGGVWTFALELAAGLVDRDIQVVLAALCGQPSAQQAAAVARIPNLCLLTTDFKLEWMHDPWKDVAESCRWLTRVVREYVPDVIHLNSYGHGGLPFAQPVVLTAHSCVLSWWSAVKGVPAPAEWSRYRAVVSEALHAASAVTAPSHFMAAAIGENYGIDSERVKVIPNGCKPDRFHCAPKEPFVFFAGRLWDEGKNARALARIAPALPWPVYVAGEGRAEGCHELGKLAAHEIAEWYSRAAIYVLPARYEPFGLSALEAALSGCALVLSDIPSLREIWSDAALFVSPDDTAALQGAIETLIERPALLAEMSRRSRRRARIYDADTMTDRYLELYRAVTSRETVCVS
jgi:glycosyltransferase involved in cell wall biosynthesis